MKRCEELLTTYITQLHEGFECRELDERRTLLATPYTYSDGDDIELLVTLAHGAIVISDFGTALSRLEMSGVNTDAPRLQERVQDAARSFGVGVFEGVLRADGPPTESADLMLRMIGAMREIDVFRHLQGDPREPRFERKLLTHLKAEFRDVEAHPQVTGMSQSVYRITAIVPRENEQVLVQAVAGGRKETGTRAVDHTYRVFSDLNGRRQPKHKVAVLAHDPGGWRQADIRILTNVAYVAGWWDLPQLDAFLRGEVPEERALFRSDPTLMFDE